MDINYVTKGKIVPLGVIIIIITYLTGGSSSSIVPFILFTGIIVGIVKNQSIADAVVAGGLTAFIGSFIVTLITLGVTYLTYGPIYMNYALSAYAMYLALYIVVGLISGALGYYISKEL